MVEISDAVAVVFNGPFGEEWADTAYVICADDDEVCRVSDLWTRAGIDFVVFDRRNRTTTPAAMVNEVATPELDKVVGDE